MSKAKIVNECIKQLRAGMVLKLVAGPEVPNSRPDFLSVGRVVVEGRSCHIAGTSSNAQRRATKQVGCPLAARSIP